MAEALVADRTSNRFYCHQCSVEINPTLPDYTCPRCQNGFIEEITTERQSNTTNSRNLVTEQQDPASQFAELWGRTFVQNFRANSGGIDSSQDDTDLEEGDLDDGGRQMPEIFPHARLAFSHNGPHQNRHPVIDNIVSHLLGSLTRSYPVFQTNLPIDLVDIHGNPGDYAWGVGGLDAIISQLLNQLEGTGAPPADNDRIESLPKVTISQQDVEKKVQCSVCMDDFAASEEVRQLPCQHKYHTDCIVPWLQLHGTCPVCRKDLNGQDMTRKDFLQSGLNPDSPSTSDT